MLINFWIKPAVAESNNTTVPRNPSYIPNNDIHIINK